MGAMEPGNRDLLALLATNLEDNYEQLVSTYWYQLNAFIARRMEVSHDAEDIVQEAFMRAYYALERYPPERILALKLRPWLYKIAWNVYCNHISRGGGGPALVPLDTEEYGSVLEQQADEKNEPPEVVFEKKELRQELEELLASLPQRYQVILYLYYFGQLNYQEISTVLNQPVGTVKVYAHRGIRLLRKTLAFEKDKVK